MGGAQPPGISSKPPVMKKVQSAVANAGDNEGADVDDLKVPPSSSTKVVRQGIMPRAKGVLIIEVVLPYHGQVADNNGVDRWVRKYIPMAFGYRQRSTSFGTQTARTMDYLCRPEGA